jgi:hypothetical protein
VKDRPMWLTSKTALERATRLTCIVPSKDTNFTNIYTSSIQLETNPSVITAGIRDTIEP